MSEISEFFSMRKAHTKAIRARYGVNCPMCATKRPNANPSLLIPTQRCRVDGYTDPRPQLTTDQLENVYEQR